MTRCISSNENFEDRLIHVINEKYRSLNYKLGELQSQIIDVSITLKNIQEAIDDLKQTKKGIDQNLIDEKIDFSLPCTNYKEFEELNERLSNDEMFLNQIVRHFSLSINRQSSLTRNLGRMIRMCMTRDLAMSFTTVKPMAGKYIFNITSKVFKDRDGTELTDHTFKESIRSIFNNTKDWDGQGNFRRKKTEQSKK